MKRTLFCSLTILSLAASSAHAQVQSTPRIPTEQELIQMQTEMGPQRRKEISNLDFYTWGLFDIFKPRNQCRYAIQVPDKVTRGTIALTFDDGPNPTTTPKILDILKAHNAKATFFVLGGKIQGNEEILKRMLEEGHHIGNHSYSHPNFHQLSSEQMRNEIKTTDRLLRNLETPTYFRYPFGNSTCDGNDIITSLGYDIVGWDIDTCDWAFADGRVSDKENETCMAPESLRTDYPNYVLREVAKTQGGVLLMHDIHANTAANLDRLLTSLEQQNYRFVTLDDMQIFPKLNHR